MVCQPLLSDFWFLRYGKLKILDLALRKGATHLTWGVRVGDASHYMLLRKKVVTFARLGGKLSAVGFPPSIIDQVLTKIVSQKHPPIPGCSLFFDEKKHPPSLGRWNFFLTFFYENYMLNTGQNTDFKN